MSLGRDCDLSSFFLFYPFLYFLNSQKSGLSPKIGEDLASFQEESFLNCGTGNNCEATEITPEDLENLTRILAHELGWYYRVSTVQVIVVIAWGRKKARNLMSDFISPDKT